MASLKLTTAGCYKFPHFLVCGKLVAARSHVVLRKLVACSQKTCSPFPLGETGVATRNYLFQQK
jgi:hypothetical protein